MLTSQPVTTRSAAGLPESRSKARVHSFASLSALRSSELDALFRTGAPASLSALEGHPRGRMLAVPGFDTGLSAAFLRQVAKSPWLLWEGKSFRASENADRGRGMNRLRFFGRRAAFPFATAVAPSMLDGRPCISIDYDLPGNPKLARPTYDELRLVDQGLFLGRGTLKRPSGEPRLLVWFALDAAQQDQPLPWLTAPET